MATLLLTACEAPPTPIPVVASTETPPLEPTQPVYRIGIAPELLSLISSDDFPVGTRVETFSPEGATNAYNVRIGIVAWDGATQSSAALHLDVRVHPLAPLNNPEMSDALTTALTSDESDAQFSFAPFGYPDGFDLRLFSPPVFGGRVSARLSQLELRVNLVNALEDAHLDVIARITPPIETNDQAQIPVERVPLYYTASEQGCALIAPIIPLCEGE